MIGELELAQSDQRPHREAFLAALDLLEVAAEKDSLEQPDSLLSDLEWLMAELDARLKNAP